MKTLPPSDYRTNLFKLNSVLLTSQDLIEVCSKVERIFGQVAVTRESTDGSKVVYEGIEDIINHVTTITVPFEIQTGGPGVDFQKLGVTISYKKSEEHLARSILSQLKIHSPIVLNYWGRTAFLLIILGVGLSSLVSYLGDFSPIPSYPELLFSQIVTLVCFVPAILIQFMAFPGLGLIVNVSHNRSTSFFQRNKDKMIFSGISFVLGVTATYLVLPATHQFLAVP